MQIGSQRCVNFGMKNHHIILIPKCNGVREHSHKPGPKNTWVSLEKVHRDNIDLAEKILYHFGRQTILLRR